MLLQAILELDHPAQVPDIIQDQPVMEAFPEPSKFVGPLVEIADLKLKRALEKAACPLCFATV